MKKILVVLLSLAMVLGLASCKPQADEFNVGTLKGPSGIGMIKMISDNAENNKIGDATVNFTIAGAPDEITAKLLSGELDAAAVPMNMASVLYNNTDGEFIIASVNTKGVIYIVENGSTITDISQLEGKTIYAAGQGSSADIVLQYTLSMYGLIPGENITVEYMTEHAEVAAKVITEEGTIALLPQPFVTVASMNNANVQIALDLNQLYEDGAESSLFMTAFIVNKEFAESYPGTVNAFLEAYEESVDYVNANVTDAAVMVETFEILPSAAIAEVAIPKCNIIFEYASDMKADIDSEMNVFFEYNPASIGGALPTDDFYYEK